MFGYKKAKNLFEEIAGNSPEDIITILKDAGSDFVKDKDPDDDVTFVVIKVKWWLSVSVDWGNCSY